MISVCNGILPILGMINAKMKLFVIGRRHVFDNLKRKINAEDQIIWFHCASLGEYEQGVPVMEKLKAQYPEHKLLVTFFSPSGYEAKKNSALADIICYLPLDTKRNAKQFVDLVKPKFAVFVKYEFWPNYLKCLKELDVPVIFISSAFRKDQAFFKWYGGFMRNSLSAIDHIFVQDKVSQELLNTIGYGNVTVSGDTRFDRVAHQIEMDNKVEFVEDFIADRICIVMGSSWPEDEEVFVDFINKADDKVCFIIAPHEIKESTTKRLQQNITSAVVSFSNKEGKKLSDFNVFVLDTIGYLSRVYNYADIAYVGGAMGNSGLHNILEPATFGIPIIIGKNFEKFREAQQLQKLAGLFSIRSSQEFNTIASKLVDDSTFREKTGMITGHFINSNTGATDTIMNYITSELS